MSSLVNYISYISRGVSPKYVDDDGIVVINQKCIRSNKVDLKESRLLSKDQKFQNEKKLQKWDILINSTGVGTLGRVAQIKTVSGDMTVDSHVTIVRANPARILPSYLGLYLSSQEREIESLARGATGQTELSRDLLKESILINVPSLVVQQKIASILSAYDDLIENNNKRIKILEKTASSVYKEWFVKFNFPENKDFIFENTKIGKIPKGWLCSFEEIADPLEGPGLRRWQFKDSGIPFVNIRTLIPNDIDLTKVQFINEQEVNSKYKHFLLQEYDHIVSSSGTLGRIVTIQKRHLPLMLNTSIIRMRTKQNSIGKWQLKHFLNSSYFQDQIKSVANGAAQLNYGPSHLKTMFGIKPSESLSTKFELLVNPMELEIMNLSEKNSILNKTKNLLLPKLISGELDVEGLDIKIRPEIL